MGIWRFGRLFAAVCLVGGSAAAQAQDEPLRITHAERIEILPAATADSRGGSAGSFTVTFTAYEREFILVLEGRDRLLSRLPPAQRRNLASYQLLRGKVANRPDSWVRLTRTPTAWIGAIWDGQELFSIAQAGSIQKSLLTPVVAGPDDSVIYRATDTDSFTGAQFCSVVDPGTGTKSTASLQPTYKQLLAELQTYSFATDLGGQIEIALIGDNEFASQNPADPQGAILARLNIVDEIFSGQLGIAILPTEIQVFTGASDPFSGTEPTSLLDQLATYRDGSPAIYNKGLAHLVTGSNLDGSTVGMAYLGSLCERRFGSSLSESRGTDVTLSALIMAHEIGHNFGAPHDGESGACATTPGSFLMSPSVNGSSTFSSCSIASMRTEIGTATCIAPATTYADVSVSASPSANQSIIGRPFDFALDVGAPGTVAVRDAILTMDIPFGIDLQSNPLPTSCTTSDRTLRCALGTLTPGTTRQIALRFNGSSVGTFRTTARVVASNDRYAANNSQDVSFTVVNGSDGTVRFEQSQYSGITRTPVTLRLMIDTVGPEALNNPQARISSFGLSILSVASDQGTCTPDSGAYVCNLGSITPPRSIGIQVVVSADSARTFGGMAVFSADNDGNIANNTAVAGINIAPTHDISVALAGSQPPVILGSPFTTQVSVASVATQTVNNVEVTLSGNAAIAMDSVTPSQGTCSAVQAFEYHCSLGTLAPGASRTLTLSSHGRFVGGASLSAILSGASFDDVESNNGFETSFDVRNRYDIGTGISFIDAAYETVPFTAVVSLSSLGLSEVLGTQVTATVSNGVVVNSATLPGGTCQVTTHTATCTLASAPGGYNGELRLGMQSASIGTYTLAVNATANTDDEPANDSATMSFDVLPYTDTAISLVSAPQAVTVGEVFSLRYQVTQNRNASTGMMFRSYLTGYVEIVSFESTFSTCRIIGSQFICDVEPLGAGSSKTVTLNLRVLARSAFAVESSVSAISDLVRENDYSVYRAFADRSGDARLTPQSSTLQLTRGQNGQATVRLVADRALDDVVVEIDTDNPAVVYLSTLNTSGGYCPGDTLHTSCSFGSLQAGESRDLQFGWLTLSSGTATVSLRLVSPNDTNAANNTAAVNISVSDVVVVAPPPTPTPVPTTPAASSGGGGGGALDPCWLVLLLGFALLRPAASRKLPRHLDS